VIGPYSLSVPFGWSKARWGEPEPVVGYYVNPSTIPGTLSAVQSAARPGRRSRAHRFSFEYKGVSTATTVGMNNKNEILWAYIDNPNILAQAGTWEDDSGNVIETDIQFNTQFSWSTNPGQYQYDIESTALHELGHWVQLLDLYGDLPGYPSDTSKVMYGRASDSAIKRTLQGGDEQGIKYIYPPVEPATNFYATPSSGGAPLTVQFTDTSTGKPTEWEWDFGDDTSSTLQHPTHTYAEIGNYTVSLTTTNSEGSNTTIKEDCIRVLAAPYEFVAKWGSYGSGNGQYGLHPASRLTRQEISM
jgi:PKD repeat protein